MYLLPRNLYYQGKCLTRDTYGNFLYHLVMLDVNSKCKL